MWMRNRRRARLTWTCGATGTSPATSCDPIGLIILPGISSSFIGPEFDVVGGGSQGLLYPLLLLSFLFFGYILKYLRIPNSLIPAFTPTIRNSSYCLYLIYYFSIFLLNALLVFLFFPSKYTYALLYSIARQFHVRNAVIQYCLLLNFKLLFFLFLLKIGLGRIDQLGWVC